MKNLVYSVLFALVSVTLNTAFTSIESSIKWKFTEFDFGVIEKGKPVDAVFTFVNESDETLLISNVKTSCGCTASDYSKDPIRPGEQSRITATYDARKPGTFTKTVKVFTNQSEHPVVLTIKGVVK